MGGLTEMANIGVKLEEQLVAVGIMSPKELMAVGSREAWLRIKKTTPSARIMLLLALEGAVRGIRWRDLDEQTKNQLKLFYQNTK
ncbi:hypothetical protein SDC9_212822 [bioreactor metagenome]|uniref:TfoX C-terminal domain-containing protein n=1 Tax=bioreactor metagenome TaxID=1076179 RepID=A0A645K1T7_9ZZZZ